MGIPLLLPLLQRRLLLLATSGRDRCLLALLVVGRGSIGLLGGGGLNTNSQYYPHDRHARGTLP